MTPIEAPGKQAFRKHSGKLTIDDNFKFNESITKFFKRVENTVGKGEIARYEQFLLFPQCFLKACFPGASIGAIVWEWVNAVFNIISVTSHSVFYPFG